MATNPFFSGRIPQALLDRIESFRKETGEGKTDILIKALAKYVGFELEKDKPSYPPIRQELNSIFVRLEQLEEIVGVDKETVVTKNKNQLELNYDTETVPPNDNSSITNDNKTDKVESSQAFPDNEADRDKENNNNKITGDNKKEVRVLSTVEASKLIGVDKSTLSRWKKKGKLPRVYKGYEIEFDRAEANPKSDYWKVKLIDNS